MAYCKNPELESLYEITRFMGEEADCCLVVAAKQGKVFLSLSSDKAPEHVLNLTESMIYNKAFADIILEAADNYRSSMGQRHQEIEPSFWKELRRFVSGRLGDKPADDSASQK